MYSTVQGKGGQCGRLTLCHYEDKIELKTFAVKVLWCIDTNFLIEHERKQVMLVLCLSKLILLIKNGCQQWEINHPKCCFQSHELRSSYLKQTWTKSRRNGTENENFIIHNWTNSMCWWRSFGMIKNSRNCPCGKILSIKNGSIWTYFTDIFQW